MLEAARLIGVFRSFGARWWAMAAGCGDPRPLDATDTTPGVETITFSDGTVLKRICHRSGTPIKVP
jgi:hypothetical protein